MTNHPQNYQKNRQNKRAIDKKIPKLSKGVMNNDEREGNRTTKELQPI